MTRWSWIPGALQFEDALLFVWLVLVTPLLQVALGGAMRGLNLGNLDSHLPNAIVLGILFLGSTLLAIVCMMTRAPEDKQASTLITGTPFGYAHLTMLAATGIMLFLGLDLVGLGDAAVGAMCVLFGLFAVIYMAYSHMPVVDYTIRRIMMTPFTILTTTLFVSSINPIFAGLNANGVLQIIQTDLGRFEFGLLLAGVLVYYLMFVFAPRQIAGQGAGWLQWAARFALYLVGMILNIQVLQMV